MNIRTWFSKSSRSSTGGSGVIASWAACLVLFGRSAFCGWQSGGPFRQDGCREHWALGALGGTAGPDRLVDGRKRPYREFGECCTIAIKCPSVTGICDPAAAAVAYSPDPQAQHRTFWRRRRLRNVRSVRFAKSRRCADLPAGRPRSFGIGVRSRGGLSDLAFNEWRVPALQQLRYGPLVHEFCRKCQPDPLSTIAFQPIS